ncbi:MAG TPA: hypothetical protein VHC90_21840 [Bryobacteraceae bacterium]|nr:hypothetical protein [Bryobacteraceae bacterium]
MTRFTTAAIGLFLLGSFVLSAQQDDTPPAPAAGDVQNPGADGPAAPPAKINPKTGLPYTPAELQQMEIDKYDPMKREVDPTADPATNPDRLTDRQNPTALPNQKKPDPIPGSIDSMNQQQAAQDRQANGTSLDPDADSAAANGAEYTGPAVLSRSYTLARPMVPRQIQWNGSLNFSYFLNTGQAPGAENGVTNYQSVSTQGRAFGWSFGGRHIWERDQIGLNYSGGYSTYGQGGLNGGNHTLNLDYSHVFSRRISFQFVESLQDLSQNYSLENPALQPGSSVANLNLSTSPSVQLLNSQILQSSSALSMTFRQTARLSYNLSGSYFVIGRTEGVGMNGRQYGGDINYRLTSKTTVGAYYSFTDYLFAHNVSTSDSHTIGAIYSYAISRNMQLQTRLGFTRLETLAYSAVPLPPPLAQILGQTSVIINTYSLLKTSDISVQLVRDFRHARTASIAYVHGEMPGNGVLLTSIQQTLTGGFGTSFFRRRVPFSTGVIYSTLSSTSGGIGFYKNETAYVSVSRSLGEGFSAGTQFSYLRYWVDNTPLAQHSIQMGASITWSPPENLRRKL